MRTTYLKAIAFGFALILFVRGFPVVLGLISGKGSTHKVCEHCGELHQSLDSSGVHHNCPHFSSQN
jgi:hypothetical protein